MNIIKHAMKEIGLSIAIKLNMAETAQKIAESDPKMLNSGHIASAIKSGSIETLDKLLDTRGKYGSKFPGSGEDAIFKALNDSSDKKFGPIMKTLDKHQVFESRMAAFSFFNLYANKPYDSSFHNFLTHSNISQAVATGFLATKMDSANGNMIQAMASKNLLDVNMNLPTTLAGSNEHTNMTLIGIAANVDNVSALKALENVYTNRGLSPKGTDLIAIKDFAFRAKQVYDEEVYNHKEFVMKSLEDTGIDPIGSIVNYSTFKYHANLDSPRYKAEVKCPFSLSHEQIPGPQNALKGWTDNAKEYDRTKHWNGYTPEEVKYIAAETNNILSRNELKLSNFDREVYQSIQIDREINIQTNKELAAGIEVSETKKIFLQIDKNVIATAIEAREVKDTQTNDGPKKPRPQ